MIFRKSHLFCPCTPSNFLIYLWRDGMHFVTHLFIQQFLPQRWDKWLNFYKNICSWKFTHWGCGKDKVSLAQRSVSSFLFTALWLWFQQYVIYFALVNICWHVCKTLLTRRFLPSLLSVDRDMLLKKTHTYTQAPLAASISAVKICNNLLVYNFVFHSHKYI